MFEWQGGCAVQTLALSNPGAKLILMLPPEVTASASVWENPGLHSAGQGARRVHFKGSPQGLAPPISCLPLSRAEPQMLLRGHASLRSTSLKTLENYTDFSHSFLTSELFYSACNLDFFSHSRLTQDTKFSPWTVPWQLWSLGTWQGTWAVTLILSLYMNNFVNIK